MGEGKQERGCTVIREKQHCISNNNGTGLVCKAERSKNTMWRDDSMNETGCAVEQSGQNNLSH